MQSRFSTITVLRALRASELGARMMGHTKPCAGRRIVFAVVAWYLGLGLVAAGWGQAGALELVGAFPRPVESVLELQVELHRRGFSCGAIDGLPGAQTLAALRRFQWASGIRETGTLTAETRALLVMREPALIRHTVTAPELAYLRPVPTTWLRKSQEPELAYATELEQVAEHYRAHPRFLQQLNPAVDWTAIRPETTILVPAAERTALSGKPAQIVIRLAARDLELFDDEGRLLAHFPVSIARSVEKRPLGVLRVTVAIGQPNYTFDPVVFPESKEGKELGRKLMIPPGPNNPVGRVWIGLDRTGYGIHGTPDPEKVGRTESHGCFRLANWDALTLLRVVRIGTLVAVEP